MVGVRNREAEKRRKGPGSRLIGSGQETRLPGLVRRTRRRRARGRYLGLGCGGCTVDWLL